MVFDFDWDSKFWIWYGGEEDEDSREKKIKRKNQLKIVKIVEKVKRQ